MRRLVLAVIVMIVVAGLTTAAAARLTIRSASVGAGNAAVSSCDADGVAVSWSTGSDPTVGYTVTSVTVSGINTANCTGARLAVTLTDAGNAQVGAGGPVTINAATMAVPVAGTVPAAPVARIHVVLA